MVILLYSYDIWIRNDCSNEAINNELNAGNSDVKFTANELCNTMFECYD